MSATVVSLLPYPIRTQKPVLPGYFEIDRAKRGEISILGIPNAFKRIYLHDNRWIKVPVPTIEVARAICHDHIVNSVASRPEAGRPGIFPLMEIWEIPAILHEHKNKIEELSLLQDQWYLTLVEMADDDWSKNETRRSITDIQKIAAKELGLKRDWLIEIPDNKIVLEIDCPKCKSQVHPDAILCKYCHAILKPEQYSSEDFATISQVG